MKSIRIFSVMTMYFISQNMPCQAVETRAAVIHILPPHFRLPEGRISPKNCGKLKGNVDYLEDQEQIICVIAADEHNKCPNGAENIGLQQHTKCSFGIIDNSLAKDSPKVDVTPPVPAAIEAPRVPPASVPEVQQVVPPGLADLTNKAKDILRDKNASDADTICAGGQLDRKGRIDNATGLRDDMSTPAYLDATCAQSSQPAFPKMRNVLDEYERQRREQIKRLMAANAPYGETMEKGKTDKDPGVVDASQCPELTQKPKKRFWPYEEELHNTCTYQIVVTMQECNRGEPCVNHDYPVSPQQSTFGYVSGDLDYPTIVSVRKQ